MKLKSSLAALTAVALFAAAPASATDLGGSKDSYAYTPATDKISWTGLYLGGRIGYGNANHDLSLQEYFKSYCGDANETDEFGFEDGAPDIGNRQKYLIEGVLVCKTPEEKDGFDSIPVDGDSRTLASIDGLNSSGITGGVQIGFDKQLNKRFVVGIFGSYDLSSMDTKAGILDVDGFKSLTLIDKGDEWSIGGRFGYLLHPRVMAYVLAAYTETDWDFISDGGTKTVTFRGATVGGGLEYALTNAVFVGIEGTHTFYGKETIFDEYDEVANRGIRVKDEIGETKVLGTIKVKIGSNLNVLE